MPAVPQTEAGSATRTEAESPPPLHLPEAYIPAVPGCDRPRCKNRSQRAPEPAHRTPLDNEARSHGNRNKHAERPGAAAEYSPYRPPRSRNSLPIAPPAPPRRKRRFRHKIPTPGAAPRRNDRPRGRTPHRKMLPDNKKPDKSPQTPPKVPATFPHSMPDLNN